MVDALFFQRDRFGSSALVGLHPSEVPSSEAQYAMELIKHFGVIAGTDGGEDSTGRAKIALMPAEEVAARAFDIAQAAYSIARGRGLMVAVPPREECLARAREEADRN